MIGFISPFLNQIPSSLFLCLQVGNAVPPPMAKHIGLEIKKCLTWKAIQEKTSKGTNENEKKSTVLENIEDKVKEQLMEVDEVKFEVDTCWIQAGSSGC